MTGVVSSPYVFVQVETTGFEPQYDQVIIVAAQHGDINFSRKVVPTVPIKPEARELNRLAVHSNCLFYEHELIFSNVVNRRKAWYDFIEFLGRSCHPPMLIGHDVQLQAHFITKEIREMGLADKFDGTVKEAKFVDTRDIFKELLPEYSSHHLRFVAEKRLESFRYDNWEMYGMPLYKLDLQRMLMVELGVSKEVIDRHAFPV